MMSATSEMLSEIKEINLSYLLLAQRLLREDRAMGMFRMGITGVLFGWAPPLRSAIRRRAARSLDAYIAARGLTEATA